MREVRLIFRLRRYRGKHRLELISPLFGTARERSSPDSFNSPSRCVWCTVPTHQHPGTYREGHPLLDIILRFGIPGATRQLRQNYSRARVNERQHDDHWPQNRRKPLKILGPMFSSEPTKLHGWLIEYDFHAVHPSFYDSLIRTDPVEIVNPETKRLRR